MGLPGLPTTKFERVLGILLFLITATGGPGLGLPGLPTTKFERVLGVPALSYKTATGRLYSDSGRHTTKLERTYGSINEERGMMKKLIFFQIILCLLFSPNVFCNDVSTQNTAQKVQQIKSKISSGDCNQNIMLYKQLLLLDPQNEAQYKSEIINCIRQAIKTEIDKAIAQRAEADRNHNQEKNQKLPSQ